MRILPFTFHFRIALLIAIPIIGAGVFLMDQIDKTRDAAKRVSCQCNFCGMTMAFHEYHDQHGHFPPAYIVRPE